MGWGGCIGIVMRITAIPYNRDEQYDCRNEGWTHYVEALQKEVISQKDVGFQ